MVTGGARGIGRAIAVALVARGHRVVVTDIDADAARRTAQEIGAVAGLHHDVRRPEGHREAAEEALRHGRLAVWVNNAGVGDDGDLADLREEQVERLVGVNLMGPLWGSRAALAAFGPEGGDLVMVASLSAHGPVPGLSVYAATKAAVVSLALSLSWEVPAGVRVHAVCPDGVSTDLVAAMAPTGRAKALVSSGGRMLEPSEVADAVVAVLGRSRVVVTLPGWRGASMRWPRSRPASAVGSSRSMRRQGLRCALPLSGPPGNVAHSEGHDSNIRSCAVRTPALTSCLCPIERIFEWPARTVGARG